MEGIAEEQIFARCDTILSRVPNVPKVPNAPKLNESAVLFAEHRRIIDAENVMATDASMSASMKTAMSEVLNLEREELHAEFVALADKKKRKASELSGTSS
jgi:hypothetical protein